MPERVTPAQNDLWRDPMSDRSELDTMLAQLQGWRRKNSNDCHWYGYGPQGSRPCVDLVASMSDLEVMTRFGRLLEAMRSTPARHEEEIIEHATGLDHSVVYPDQLSTPAAISAALTMADQSILTPKEIRDLNGHSTRAYAVNWQVAVEYANTAWGYLSGIDKCAPMIDLPVEIWRRGEALDNLRRAVSHFVLVLDRHDELDRLAA
jgi:hypothetical protein